MMKSVKGAAFRIIARSGLRGLELGELRVEALRV